MKTKVRFLDIGFSTDATDEMRRIGVDPVGIAMMLKKQFHHNFKIEGLSCAAANILKQEALTVGAEAAVSKGVVSCSIDSTGCVLSGTERQIEILIEKLSAQPYGLKDVGAAVGQAMANVKRPAAIFSGRSRSWDLTRKTLVMGVLNVTPDSFSDGGVYGDVESALVRGFEMSSEGADIIDVGGESTRPGAIPVGVDEELRRVIPVVEGLSRKGIAVSIDTTKAKVALEAVNAGAEIINDISAAERDKEMPGVIAKSSSGVILMHMRGTPETMSTLIEYGDILSEVHAYLGERVDALSNFGVKREKVAIDPGIGFAKRAEDNLLLLKRLREFSSLGSPLLVGVSRKSFISKTLGASYGTVEERMLPTMAGVCVSVMNGASIVRVHDVKEAVAVCSMTNAIMKSGCSGKDGHIKAAAI